MSSQLKILILVCVIFGAVDRSFGQSRERLSRRKRDSCFPEKTGTTPMMKNIFLGRCWEFQFETAIPNACPDNPVHCLNLWDQFHSAIAYKDPCAIPEDAYTAFVQAVPHQLPADKTIFWSGTSYIVHEYTEAVNDLLSLEDTLLGYMVEGLQWCSSTNQSSSGLDYDSCPPWNQANCNVASTAFYAGTSTAIAAQSVGVITLMLDGSREEGAFLKGSFFEKYELPNLDPVKVTRADLIVINRIGQPSIETCGTGSVATLQKAFHDKGIPTTCDDHDRRVLHIQCSKDPDLPECAISGARTLAGHCLPILISATTSLFVKYVIGH